MTTETELLPERKEPEGFRLRVLNRNDLKLEDYYYLEDLLKRRTPSPAQPETWERLQGLVSRYHMPCLGDCEHHDCPLLKELWLMTEEERVKDALNHAKETVQPIIDREKKGEEVDAEIMNMRLRSPAQPEWLPIESAPKDGEDLLLWVPASEFFEANMDLAYWRVDAQAWDTADGWLQGEPSHWMRPQPPKGPRQ